MHGGDRRMLSRDDARRFYDRFGAKQDNQAFYEDAAVNDLIVHSHFEKAQAVCEFGCGTGRLANRLIADLLPQEARYNGFDLSATMVGLARSRLASYGDRAEVTLTDGSPMIPQGDCSVERFIAAYVLDLLDPLDARDLLREARRVLRRTGKLCLVSITPGPRGCSRLLSALWERVFRVRPSLVGGCHPILLSPLLHPSEWVVEYRRVVVAYCVASEVVVATPV